jgi:hypothetical protein
MLQTRVMGAGPQLGAYRLLHPIGEGGMGTVYVAEHAALGRRAAIKVLHPAFSMRPDIVMRFFNEARAASAITDPGIIQIFDVGQHTDGSAYIVMELLEGEPLDRRLRMRRALPVEAALRIVRQVAKSLGAAHARGIVHRDLKPENIFLVPDTEVIGGERAKILDFGIAKLIGETNLKTQTSAVMGTPAYMSPEQCRGAGAVDERADVYSLGCVLFTLITGRPPFDAEGGGEIIAMHLREAPPRLSSLAPGISPELDALVARCLEKDPARRFASGGELAAAISQLAAQPAAAQPAAAATVHAPARAAASTASTANTTLSAATGSFRPARSRKTSIAVVGAVAAVAVGAVLAAVALRSQDAPTAGTSPALAAGEPAAAAPPAAAPPAPPPAAQPAPPAAAPPTAAPPAAAPPAATPPAITLPSQAPAAEPAAPATPTPAAPRAEPAAAPKGARPRREASAKPPEASAKPPEASAKPTPQASRDKKPADPDAADPRAAAQPDPPAEQAAAKPGPESKLPEKLDRTMISNGVYTVRQRIMACGAGFPGTQLRLSVTVTPEGTVSNVVVKDSPDPWLSGCVAARMKGAFFAKTRSGGAFSQPFVF